MIKKMRNKILNLLVVMLLAVFSAGCEEEPLIFDAENGQTLAQFSDSEVTIITPVEGAEATVDVLVSTQSSEPRTIEVQVNEELSTASADQYEISDLVIPANSFVGTITISSNYDALPEEGSTSLVLDLVGIEGEPEAVVENGTFEVELIRKCEFELTGDFLDTSGWFEEQFQVEVLAGAEPGQYVIPDLFAEGTDITFTVNEDYSITIPKQNAWVHPTYGQASVEGAGGSFVDLCEEVFTLNLKHTVAAGSFGTYAEVFTPYVPEPTEGEGDGTDGEGTDGEGTDGDGSGA